MATSNNGLRFTAGRTVSLAAGPRVSYCGEPRLTPDPPSGMYAEWHCQVGAMPVYPQFAQGQTIVESTHFQP